MFTCPICGYDRLSRPPRDFVICACCGNEFGYDDARASHAQLRHEWTAAGAAWFSDVVERPYLWTAVEQLERAGFLTIAPTDSAATASSPVHLLSRIMGPKFSYGLAA